MLQKFSIQDQSIIKGGFWAFASKIGNTLIVFLLNIAFSRILSPADLGNYYLVQSMLALFINIALFGIPGAIIKIIGESIGQENFGKAKQAIFKSILFTLASSFVIAIIVFSGAGVWIADKVFHSINIQHIIDFVTFLTIIFALQTLLVEILRGLQDIRSASIFEGLFGNIVFFIVIILFQWLKKVSISIRELFGFMIIANIISLSISGFILSKKILLIQVKNTTVKIGEIIRLSWPIWVTGMTYYILTKADIWILGIYEVPETVAIYGLSLKLVGLITMPLLIVNATITPKISELFTQGAKPKLENLLQNATTIAGIPSIILLFGYFILGSKILVLLYGSYYKGGSIILIILGVGQLINALAGPCGLVLMQTGFQKTLMLITIISGVSTIFLSIFLTIKWGAVGIAISTTLGQLLQNSFMLFYSRRLVGISTNFKINLLPQLIKKVI